MMLNLSFKVFMFLVPTFHTLANVGNSRNNNVMESRSRNLKVAAQVKCDMKISWEFFLQNKECIV